MVDYSDDDMGMGMDGGEDAGKSKLEISKINEPEITLSFLADGVIIKN